MLTGVVGYLRWHYYTAAQIEGYTVTRNKEGTVWRLAAFIVLANEFNLAQTPLDFVATHKKGQWTWRIKSWTLNRDTHRLVAQLDPPNP
jgi:hypothetical protein